MKRKLINIGCMAILFGALSCSSIDNPAHEDNGYGFIQVGSLTMGTKITTSVSKAPADEELDSGNETANQYDAESIDWFKPVLERGVEVVYSNEYDENGIIVPGKEQKCTLKYVGGTGKSKYVLLDKNNLPAKWLGNGLHLFCSSYVPEDLKTNTTYSTDQSTKENYDLLCQYTSMEPSTKISATVERIVLPFQHRLARIITQVIIDPSVKSDYTQNSDVAQINGYNSTDGGGANCSIRFCKVKVLTGLNDNKPVWNTVEKVIPHFIGEAETVNYKKNEEDIDGTDYHNVPCFDLIVRPTYLECPLLPDEPEDVPDDEVNQISFLITLNNGLIYKKDVEFDLNPNEQTTIVLYITREGVDYNDSGANNWIQNKFTDGYYGIDNQNGHTLSKAGSSWQRAIQVNTGTYSVTDGHKPDSTQYLKTNAEFIDALKEAKVGGKHHGDYFILTSDLVLNDWVPFDFTGHLDGRNHKITVNGATALFSSMNGAYDAEIGTANVHSSNSPLKGYRAEVMNLVLNPGASLVSGNCSGYLFHCTVSDPAVLYGNLVEYGKAEECIIRRD